MIQSLGPCRILQINHFYDTLFPKPQVMLLHDRNRLIVSVHPPPFRNDIFTLGWLLNDCWSTKAIRLRINQIFARTRTQVSGLGKISNSIMFIHIRMRLQQPNAKTLFEYSPWTLVMTVMGTVYDYRDQHFSFDFSTVDIWHGKSPFTFRLFFSWYYYVAVNARCSKLATERRKISSSFDLDGFTFLCVSSQSFSQPIVCKTTILLFQPHSRKNLLSRTYFRTQTFDHVSLLTVSSLIASISWTPISTITDLLAKWSILWKWKSMVDAGTTGERMRSVPPQWLTYSNGAVRNGGPKNYLCGRDRRIREQKHMPSFSRLEKLWNDIKIWPGVPDSGWRFTLTPTTWLSPWTSMYTNGWKTAG